MATAKRRRKPKTSPWTHEYSVTKVDPTLQTIDTVVVLGSRDALAKQIEFEDAGFFAVVFNVTTNEEEYRTPGCEK